MLPAGGAHFQKRMCRALPFTRVHVHTKTQFIALKIAGTLTQAHSSALSRSLTPSLPHPAICRAVEGATEGGVLIRAVGAILQSIAEIGGAPHTAHA